MTRRIKTISRLPAPPASPPAYMQTLRIGRAVFHCLPTRDLGALRERLAKCTGKTKRSAIKPDTPRFPKFLPDDSTEEYVRRYELANSHRCLTSIYDLAGLNCEPCTLYSGEDTEETLADELLAA